MDSKQEYTELMAAEFAKAEQQGLKVAPELAAWPYGAGIDCLRSGDVQWYTYPPLDAHHRPEWLIAVRCKHL